MTFSIRAILVLCALTAILCLLTVRYPPMGVAAASFLPFVWVCLLRRRRSVAEDRRKWLRQSLAGLFVVVPIYAASLGPYAMSFAYYAFTPAPRPIQSLHKHGAIIYAPLNWLHEHTSAREPLEWYADQWGDYGRQLGLDQSTLGELDQSLLDEYEEAMNEYLSADQANQG